MSGRPYAGSSDLRTLQDFNAAMWQAHGGVGWMHVGDIPHRIYNALGRRGFHPSEVVRIWETNGVVAGWAMIWPRSGGIEVQVPPDSPQLAVEAGLWACEAVVAVGEQHGHHAKSIVMDVVESEPNMVDLATGIGMAVDQREGSYIVTRQAIDRPPQVHLPRSYSVRAARGVGDAAALAGVHSSAFNSDWTAESYARVMESPGYEPSREIVVVAPDGSFAGFCIIWMDHENHIGMFEPVGVHADHRRRGVGMALMAAGLSRLSEHGMVHAMVTHETDDPASTALYAAAGFLPWYRYVAWSKAL
ncbi:MAG: GNAT family N-acetyltransferase [Acidimicrobiia bacterium]|nr:GNAT family N-acetyltransferase [Acidimicrobiia bacterium]